MAKKKDRKQDRKRMQREMQAALMQAMLDGGNGMAPMAGGRGLLARLGKIQPGQQLLLGALLGAAAVYVLGDEKLRGKIMKSGMNLYASLLGGFEEMKEQAADLRAELEVERGEAV